MVSRAPDTDAQALFSNIISSVHDFLELTREYSEQVTYDDGVVSDNGEKIAFQVSGQFERPGEYIQCLLDLVRCHFEPMPLGTFFLNSNIGILIKQLSRIDGNVNYLSVLSEENEGLLEFLVREVPQEAYACDALFLVISAGEQRYNVDLVEDVPSFMGLGFSIDGVDLYIKTTGDAFEHHQRHIGFCRVPELGRKLRASIWYF